MTISYTKRLIAIILCIVLTFSSLCVAVCISDKAKGNAQFFAANFYLIVPDIAKDSLSGDGEKHVVSWIRSSNWIPERASFISPIIAEFQFLLDKLCFNNTEYSKDFYTDFKKAMYFFRI